MTDDKAVKAEKKPEATVALTGTSGSAEAVIEAVAAALEDTGATDAQVAKFRKQAAEVSYEDLFDTVAKWAKIT